jgi:hypothetical protein
MVWCDNGLDVVRMVHRVSRFVHAAAAREFPRVLEKSSEIPEIPEFAVPRLARRDGLAPVLLHLNLRVTLVAASPEPSTCTPGKPPATHRPGRPMRGHGLPRSHGPPENTVNGAEVNNRLRSRGESA